MCSWPATSEYLVSANDYDEFISWELIYPTPSRRIFEEPASRRAGIPGPVGRSCAVWAGGGGSFSSALGMLIWSAAAPVICVALMAEIAADHSALCDFFDSQRGLGRLAPPGRVRGAPEPQDG